MMLTLAIVGRPNVGKSTLFNRLAGKRLALVHDTPGVTRDRREAEGRVGSLRVRLVDTAGLEEAEAGSLAGRMRAMTESAVAEADIVLFVIDARAGVTPYDQHFAEILRRSGRPLVLVTNKCEGREAEAGVAEAFALGLGTPVELSAEHGLGLDELAQAVADLAETLTPATDDPDAAEPGAEGAGEDGEEGAPDRPLRLAIVGRPNVGKSTLINRLLGEERLLTGPEAGITRDSISVDWSWQGRAIKLYDTAGMRRRARISETLEKMSVGDTLRVIRFAEVVVVVLDATMALEKQDAQIAELVANEGRGIVLALNKWDLVEDRDGLRRALTERLDILLPQIKGVPLVPVSATTGTGLPRLMEAVTRAYEGWTRRVSTGQLNRWLADTVAAHQPPAAQGRPVRLRYITQAKARPPTFALFVSRPEAIPQSYMRYLSNALRESFDFPGTPLRFVMRKPKNPYTDEG
ncbi:MAG: ribosome biogenesis GTPase Der [Alphaproteobacteria bacterium]|nr:ribosome biogenesis GTPase Der [Alphaproteobacteria bacterium]